MEIQLNILYRDDLQKQGRNAIIENLDMNTAALLEHDLNKAFPDLKTYSRILPENSNLLVLPYEIELIIRCGIKPSQNTLDNLFWYIKGWLMAKKYAFVIK